MASFGWCQDHSRTHDDATVFEFFDDQLGVFESETGKRDAPTTIYFDQSASGVLAWCLLESHTRSVLGGSPAWPTFVKMNTGKAAARRWEAEGAHHPWLAETTEAASRTTAPSKGGRRPPAGAPTNLPDDIGLISS